MIRLYPMTFLVILIAGAFVAAPAHSQVASPAASAVAKTAPPAPQKLPQDVVDYFSGEWSGKGEFASGKKIEADIGFRADLDGQWLAYRHTDRPPGKYKAAGLWGFERASKAFVMTLNDSSGGARTFSSTGWRDGRVVFERDVDASAEGPAAARKRERFTFLRETDDRMKMVYEVNPDGGHWKMVDYLIFVRR